MKPGLRILLAMAVFGLLAGPVPAVVIKIGSIAPSRSPWDKALNEMAVDWDKISGGQVQVRIYAGGIAGNEEDMLRMMRVGTLGGAVLTNLGIAKINPDVLVLNTPFLFDSEREFNYLFDQVRTLFEQQVEAKGFKVLIWTMAGWVHFFSKDKVLYPDDLKKCKLSFVEGEPQIEHAFKKMGYQIVPNDLKDLLMALQSGMVTAFYLPPLMAGSGQYFALAPNMLALRMAPLVGGLVLTDKAWKSIPAQFTAALLKAAQKATDGLILSTRDLEKDAIKTMKENGLIVNEPPADALEKWRAVVSRGMDELVDKAFSKQIYERVLAIIHEFRQKLGK